MGRDDWRARLLGFLEGVDHPVMGRSHSRRVFEMTIRLAQSESVFVDEDVVYAAAMLHDLGALDPYRRAETDHAKRGVTVAPVILEQVDFDIGRTAAVCEVIQRHMYYEEPSSASVEARLFRDANTLDLLGGIGIMRTLGSVGTTDWVKDLGEAVDMIRRHRRDLPQMLVSDSARNIAEERQGRMEDFLQMISRETDGLRLI